MDTPSKEAIDFFRTWIDARMEVDIWDTDSLKEGLQGCYAIDFAAHQQAMQGLANALQTVLKWAPRALPEGIAWDNAKAHAQMLLDDARKEGHIK